jgi:nitrate/nitrite-specific signal transduction histidine kinase
MEADRKRDQEDLKGIMAEINAKMDANQAKADGKQEEVVARMREDIKYSQAEMRSIPCTFRSELRETVQSEMRTSIQSVRSELEETTTCREATETVPDPGMMQSKSPRERPQ